MGAPADKIHAYTTGTGWNGDITLNEAGYKWTGSLPTQVHKIYGSISSSVEFERKVGKKSYELTDHLGNVRTVVNDVKYVTDVNSDGFVDAGDEFMPEVKHYTDYYAFGMTMSGRNFNAGDYRYGFNGKENDDEVKGNGNQQDYGMRIYDGRIAKFLSVDPMQIQYPWYTPYQFAGNMPIFAVDIDGLEPEKILNEAERLLNTPYEFGGKNPAPEVINMLSSPEARKYWEKTMKPKLRLLYNYHPVAYGASDCTDEEKLADWSAMRSAIYAVWPNITKKGRSLGVDCSGFVYKCYQQDQQLLMSSQALNGGSKNQLRAFKRAAKSEEAYIHKDFNIISAGDFLYKPGHVMVATGNVKKDADGNVTEYETMEAKSTDAGTVKVWRKVDKSTTIAHPFRTSDKTQKTVPCYVVPSGERTDNFSPKERTAENVQQTTVEQ